MKLMKWSKAPKRIRSVILVEVLGIIAGVVLTVIIGEGFVMAEASEKEIGCLVGMCGLGAYLDVVMLLDTLNEEGLTQRHPELREKKNELRKMKRDIIDAERDEE